MRCIKHLNTEYNTHETQLIKEILSFGIANGEFAKHIKKELDILPSVIASSLRGLERDIFTTTKYAKFESRIESILGIMMRGLKVN